jgi:hypothetical protein
MKCFELRNALPAPATDETLVAALIEFANGRDVVIWDQPPPLAQEVRRWSLWREQPSQDERAAHVNFLHRVTEDPWGGLGFRTDASGRRRPSNAVIQMPPLLGRERDRGLLPDQDFNACLAHMNASMQRELVFVAHHHGYSLADFRAFPNVASALALAMALVMDQARPFAKAFCRCKLPDCQDFYLAQKNPKGGPPNRTYCKPEHRDQHHNSAERKSAGQSARKHK